MVKWFLNLSYWWQLVTGTAIDTSGRSRHDNSLRALGCICCPVVISKYRLRGLHIRVANFCLGNVASLTVFNAWQTAELLINTMMRAIQLSGHHARSTGSRLESAYWVTHPIWTVANVNA